MQTAKDAENLVVSLKKAGWEKADIIRKLAELCLGWPYVYAAAGEMCTPEWRKNRMGYSNEKYAKAIKDSCPVLCGTQLEIVDPYNGNKIKTISCEGCQWYGCRCFDCRGFTRWLLSQVEITLGGGGATSQWDTGSNWIAKGKIETMPPNLVCCVFKQKDGKMSHTGMSMGDGKYTVIHCSTTVKYGNVKTDYSKWTHWGVPRGLYSVEELKKAGIHADEKENKPTLRRGSKGESVKELQTILNSFGNKLNIDGIFGAKTEEAVKSFQKSNHLSSDGIVGPKTWEELYKTYGEYDPDLRYTVTIPNLSYTEMLSLVGQYKQAVVE